MQLHATAVFDTHAHGLAPGKGGTLVEARDVEKFRGFIASVTCGPSGHCIAATRVPLPGYNTLQSARKLAAFAAIGHCNVA